MKNKNNKIDSNIKRNKKKNKNSYFKILKEHKWWTIGFSFVLIGIILTAILVPYFLIIGNNKSQLQYFAYNIPAQYQNYNNAEVTIKDASSTTNESFSYNVASSDFGNKQLPIYGLYPNATNDIWIQFYSDSSDSNQIGNTVKLNKSVGEPSPGVNNSTLTTNKNPYTMSPFTIAENANGDDYNYYNSGEYNYPTFIEPNVSKYAPTVIGTNGQVRFVQDATNITNKAQNGGVFLDTPQYSDTTGNLVGFYQMNKEGNGMVFRNMLNLDNTSLATTLPYIPSYSTWLSHEASRIYINGQPWYLGTTIDSTTKLSQEYIYLSNGSNKNYAVNTNEILGFGNYGNPTTTPGKESTTTNKLANGETADVYNYQTNAANTVTNSNEQATIYQEPNSSVNFLHNNSVDYYDGQLIISSRNLSMVYDIQIANNTNGNWEFQIPVLNWVCSNPATYMYTTNDSSGDTPLTPNSQNKNEIDTNYVATANSNWTGKEMSYKVGTTTFSNTSSSWNLSSTPENWGLNAGTYLFGGEHAVFNLNNYIASVNNYDSANNLPLLDPNYNSNDIYVSMFDDHSIAQPTQLGVWSGEVGLTGSYYDTFNRMNDENFTDNQSFVKVLQIDPSTMTATLLVNIPLQYYNSEGEISNNPGNESATPSYITSTYEGSTMFFSAPQNPTEPLSSSNPLVNYIAVDAPTWNTSTGTGQSIFQVYSYTGFASPTSVTTGGESTQLTTKGGQSAFGLNGLKLVYELPIDSNSYRAYPIFTNVNNVYIGWNSMNSKSIWNSDENWFDSNIVVPYNNS